MPHTLSTALLNVYGPCRLLLVGSQGQEVLTDLLLAGCDAWSVQSDGADQTAAHPRSLALNDIQALQGSFDTVLVQARADANLLVALMQLFQYTGMLKNLALAAPGHERQMLESGLFIQGWRRHPKSLAVADYPQLTDRNLGEISFYQRIPADVAATWPVEKLMQDRNLHMDMLRESGSRADAHIVRYALAAKLIRPGDTVVDCACGLGYGSAVMSAMSRGARFLAFDLDPGVIDYAQANYGHDRLSYAVGDAEALAAIPDASVDMVVSMETIEHVPDWERVLAEFRRILKPDGRLIASVPDRWVDATGRDPNPYHLHAFDWAKFAAGLSRHFIIETRYVQTAPGGFKLQRSPRLLSQVPLDANVDSEWLLAVASVNPLAEGQARRDAFSHPAFKAAFDASGSPVIDFSDSYDNPYLYRPLVQLGERLDNEQRLVELAQQVLATATSQSADLGAALTVIGYRVLEGRLIDLAKGVIARIRQYIDGIADLGRNPHVARWCLSLMYLAGRLAALRGDREDAISWYQSASKFDWRIFSPTIATKVVGAAFFEAVQHLADGDEARAKDCFTRGLTQALAAGRCPAVEIVGNLDNPIPFALQELAEVMDMGGQCAVALDKLPLWRDSPGLFWQQIDVKRFGLASVVHDLVKANDALNGEMHRLQAANQRLTAGVSQMQNHRAQMMR